MKQSMNILKSKRIFLTGRQKKGNDVIYLSFSFCNYPFILTPALKSDILKVESMVQMRHELQVLYMNYYRMHSLEQCLLA